MLASELFNTRWHEERSCFLKLSAAFFWWVLVMFNVFVCNLLLQNACKNHQNYDRYTTEKCPNMVPKPLQNWSWRGCGGHLGATLETRCFQDLTFDDFGSNLGPPLGPSWTNVGHHFFMFFWSGFLMALASIRAPKTPPKWDPKGGQNQNLEIIDFVAIYNTLATFRGAENGLFLMLFWNPVLGWFLEPILVILAHFWGPFWRPFWLLFGYHFCINF